MKTLSLAARTCITTGLVLLCSAGLARAEQFTFNVPVALYSLPANYTGGKVLCKCSSVDRSGQGSTGNTKGGQGNYQMGGAEKDFGIGNGTFVGTIKVAFNAISGANPANATDWSCSLMLYDNTTRRWLSADSAMSQTYNRSKPYRTADKGYFK